MLDRVKRCIEELAESASLEIPALTPETELFGGGGFLDSLGLVNLVLSLEESIEEEMDVSLSLTDAKALSEKNSPFRSVGALAEYATRRLSEEGRS